MSSLRELLSLLEKTGPEERQALIICLVNQTGPVKRTLSSDFGAGGLFNEVNRILDGIVEADTRARRTAAFLKWLCEVHCDAILGAHSSGKVFA